MLTLQPVPDAPRRRHEWLFPLAAFPRRCRHCLRLENELIVCANQEVGWCDGVAPAPSPTPTEIQRLAERLAFSIAPYPSERGSVAKLLIAFADEIIIDSMRLMSNRLQPTTSRLISNPTKGTQNE